MQSDIRSGPEDIPRSYRVLVVDDDPAIRRLMDLLLRDAGHIVDAVPDGAEAIDCIESAPPDLVVLDLGLPMLGGMDVLRRMRTIEAAPPAVVVSANVEARREALELGAAAFVPKPFDLDSLMSAVNGTLGITTQFAGPDRR